MLHTPISKTQSYAIMHRNFDQIYRWTMPIFLLPLKENCHITYGVGGRKLSIHMILIYNPHATYCQRKN
jgi:hypothetical protein